MSQLKQLQHQVSELFNSTIEPTAIADLGIKLQLLQMLDEQDYSPSQVEAIWANMPYWAFLWSSGRALANYVLSNPHLVKNKVIADFGAGSGVVALSALKAGAKKAWVIDIDDRALMACDENARLNNLNVHGARSLDEIGVVDLILVGDVLYDPRNHNLASILFTPDKSVIWAESQAQTKLGQYMPTASIASETFPNIGGFDEHKQIHIYHHGL